jgi:hypothetical protein
MADVDVPYEALLAEAIGSGQPVIAFLRQALEDAWYAAYVTASGRKANVLVFTNGTFTYIYDHYDELLRSGAEVENAASESRLVAAVGTSITNAKRRAHDDGRLRGWVGPTEKTFGAGWDKGHFIAHSLGGAVDGLEANVFVQLRGANRGGYRNMEQYCAANPGVLCFSRPMYDDNTALPAAVEFGVLRPDMTWWIQRFPNRRAGGIAAAGQNTSS